MLMDMAYISILWLRIKSHIFKFLILKKLDQLGPARACPRVPQLRHFDNYVTKPFLARESLTLITE